MNRDNITIYYRGKIYNIEKENFETNEDAYNRAWYIIKNQNMYDYNELISRSLIYLNEKNNNMVYKI
jgi:hypothetical protein